MIHLRRKILAAIVSSLLFALIFSFIGGFDRNGFFNFLYLNITFALTYGLIGSMISDWISKKLTDKPNFQELSSFIMHCGLGTVFLILGLCSAILFYIVDRALKKFTIGWIPVVVVLAIVIGGFIYLLNA